MSNKKSNLVNIWVVGIGEDGLDGLGSRAKAVISSADILVGGQRHHGLVPEFSGVRLDWSAGIEAGIEAMHPFVNAQQKVVVLASGDPLYFGVGNNIVAEFGADRVMVLPTTGAVALACAAMGWSQPDIQVVTLHGRALDNLNLYLTHHARLIVLTHDGDTPAQVAGLLCSQGFSTSRLSVLEHLGGPKEHRQDGNATDWNASATTAFAPLNTMAITLIADADAAPLSRTSGLPDDAYDHDGQLTKQMVRAMTLASLAPKPGEILWDFGGGAGSISIEWMRAHERCSAVAIERDPVRAQRIIQNAKNLGVPRLNVMVTDNQAALKSLTDTPNGPDAVFIGGGLSTPGLIDGIWERLRPGGRLVVNAVTPASQEIIDKFQQIHGGTLTRVSIEHKIKPENFKDDGKSSFEPKAPILQYMGIKAFKI